MDAVRAKAIETGLYEVVAGDTLWDISKRISGNPFRYPEWFKINRDVISNENLITPGMILRVPPPPGEKRD